MDGGHVHRERPRPAPPTLQFKDTNPCASDSYGDFIDDVQVVPVASLEPSNTTWLTAEPLTLTSQGTGAEDTGGPSPSQSIDFAGEGLWYDFPIQPGEQVQVSLSNLPADYNVDLFSDISQTFKSETSSTPDLAALGAEASASAFSASAFSASAFSASAFSASAFSASAFSASAFSASAFSASAFSASAFSASAFSASAFSTAYSDSQVNSVLAASTQPGTVTKTLTADAWNDTGNFYVPLSGENGAFSPGNDFALTVTTSCTPCVDSQGNPITLETDTTPTLTGAGTSYSTLVVENQALMDLRYPTAAATLDVSATQNAPAGAIPKLLAALGSGAGVVNVGQDLVVQNLVAQAQANPSCPFVMENLEAEAIQNIINTYRTPGLKYVVIVGDDDVIPFFRYPDNAGLAPERTTSRRCCRPRLRTPPSRALLPERRPVRRRTN